ncbi:MAG: glycoside hydrolase 43 family protein, partial [Muribaculaceae bacterium]|nr:glycoside hydrolase 43 family protein [Muribaculaceae bacterium]
VYGGVTVSNPANLQGRDYVNPIICADYSDPDVTTSPDGKFFYMTASSFQSTPGLPILKSADLVNWEIVNYALPLVPPVDYYNELPRHGKGVWAPCIRYHEGKYYIYWGDPDFGIFMIETEDPEGEWSEPVLVKGGKGWIDPTPFWDEDGKAYLANGWAASRAGFNSIITLSEMSADGKRLISDPVIVYDGNDGINHTIEGPKLYHKDGYYYIFSPAGGVVDGWQLVMRSKNIYGPYESKIVMAQGETDINGPHQGAWITTADGENWFVHFQDRGAYGRIIHLNPMEWKDGWPVIGNDKDGDGCGEPVKKWRKPAIASHSRKHNDKSGGSKIDTSMLYQWHGNYNEFFGFPSNDALIRIYGHKVSDEFVNLWEVPNLWLQKFPAEKFTFTSNVRITAKQSAEGVSSGIVVMGWDYARLGLEKRGDEFALIFTDCKDAEQGGAELRRDVAIVKPTRVYNAGLHPNLECDIFLRVSVGEGGNCSFSYSTDGKNYQPAGTFKARAGKWIGAKVGFYSITPAGVSDRGWIDVKDSEIKINK